MFQNEWFLDLDIKFQYTGFAPVYRRGDTSVLKMRLHDNTQLFDLATATEAMITIVMPSGLRLDSSATFESDDIGKLIVFKFEPLHMLEIGTYNILLTVSDGQGKVSPQPFKVRFFDSLSSANQSLIQMIQDLQAQLANLENMLAETVKVAEKGEPNGVATLDGTGRIPENQLPIYLIEHLNEEVFSNRGAHGFRVNQFGLGMYRTPNDKWEYLGYSDVPLLSLKLNTTVKDGIVTLIYTGEDTASVQKWLYGSKDRADFDNAGNHITGLSFNVTQEGTYTIYYEDSIGNSYLHRFMVTDAQLAEPKVDIEISGGNVTIKPERPLEIMKWDTDTRDVAYFQDNGILIVDNKFKITVAGTYTIYYKTKGGKEYVKVFIATQDDITPNIVITLKETATNEIEVSITSKNTIVRKKWDIGSHDISYFTNNGKVLANNIIPYTSSGFYTVYAEDNSGYKTIEIIEVVYKDIEPPVIQLTPSTTTFTNQNIIITINVQDSSSIDVIKWASGDRTAEYFETGGVEVANNSVEVDTNGIYTAYARDSSGNTAVKTIAINIIDKVMPTATASQIVSGNKSTITVNAQDDFSGIKSITNPDMSVVNTSTSVFVAYSNTTYNFKIEDKAGNIYILPVVVNQLDVTPPILNLSSTPSSWTSGNATVTATATDSSGIKITKWATGSVSSAFFATGGVVFTNTFNVSANGIYTVYAEDNSGNGVIQTITISVIDKTAPTLNITRSSTASQVTFNVSCTDGQSGVNRIVKPDGTIAYSTNTVYTVSDNGNYTFEAYDNVNNKATKTENVNTLPITTKLSSMARGSEVTFAGNTWVLTDPVTNTLWAKNSLGNIKYDNQLNTYIFNLSSSDNIGYYLNTTYYGSLTTQQQNMITTSVWNNGFENDEASYSISAKIGLITNSQWKNWSSYWNSSGGFLDAPSVLAWTMTPVTYTGSDTGVYAIPKQGDGWNLRPATTNSTTVGVLPMIRLISTTRVAQDGQIILS